MERAEVKEPEGACPKRRVKMTSFPSSIILLFFSLASCNLSSHSLPGPWASQTLFSVIIIHFITSLMIARVSILGRPRTCSSLVVIACAKQKLPFGRPTA